MGSLSALREGLTRAWRAPALLTGTFALTLLVALPLSIALRGMLAAHLGPSLAAEAAASGVNYEWWQEYSAQATGLGTTFGPSVMGFGAVLLNLSNLLDNVDLAATIVGATTAWVILFGFLSGGILDRLARNRRTRARGFFGACGAHFPALARLGLLALAVYAALFHWVHPLLFTRWSARLTHELAVERSAFIIRLALYAVFGALLVLTNIVVDYARIRIVVEDRRSALGALVAGARFAGRHAALVGGLYLLNALLFLVLLAVYAAVARGTAPAGPAAWLVLLAGELYILGRHFLKLTFYASETALFQARLAHAGYTAAPAVVWPDSPAAEAISNARPAARP